MKRLISMISVLAMIPALTACGGGGGASAKVQQKLGGSFSANMVLEMEDFTGEGVLTRYDSGIWSVYFDSPAEVSGVLLDFSGEEVTASYKGLAFSVPQAAMPSKALLVHLIQAVDEIADTSDVTGTEKDGLIVMEGELETGPYELCLNKDGSLAGFAMKNMGASITFTDFTTDMVLTTTAATIASLVITTSGTTVTETIAQ
ncbi:MAG: hypothetical protein IJ496_03570 [Ruminococcus sp.]|nr:hypothetical protein [Ruminococcus sp.]